MVSNKIEAQVTSTYTYTLTNIVSKTQVSTILRSIQIETLQNTEDKNFQKELQVQSSAETLKKQRKTFQKNEANIPETEPQAQLSRQDKEKQRQIIPKDQAKEILDKSQAQNLLKQNSKTKKLIPRTTVKNFKETRQGHKINSIYQSLTPPLTRLTPTREKIENFIPPIYYSPPRTAITPLKKTPQKIEKKRKLEGV